MCAAPVTDERLERGRSAAAGRAWREAVEDLSAVDAQQPLGAEDLELLAKASWWTGQAQASIDARERAFRAYLDRGERARAAFMALTLRREYTAKLASSVAAGWLNRAERLLEEEPESIAHGYLALAHGELARSREDFDHAMQHFDRAAEVAARFDDANLTMWTSMRRADVHIARGEVDAGWPLMEEAGTAAVGGELGAFTTGAIFCNVMTTCCELADYRRANEWSDVAKRWCERQDIAGFPGVCRVYRAEIMRLLGAWDDAEREVTGACTELQEFHPAIAAHAFRELGEVRLRRGDLAGAEEAFRQAQEVGEDPNPGLAMLLLAAGRAPAAAAAIRGSLEEGGAPLRRARLLPAQATIARELGDLDAARAAASELTTIAEEYRSVAIRAARDEALASVAELEGDAGAARRHLREARRHWREMDAPYEAARATTALAISLAADDREAARLELDAARATFDRLGAGPDLERVTAILAGLDRPASSREVRTFVFTDIVGSTTLVEAIGDEAWRDLRRWHDATLRAAFERHDGEEIDHAGDGFFVAFPDAERAVTCAQEIQRTLARHRSEQGFAPSVRIGLHATEATQDGDGYSGAGVHTAARIGGLAGGGEILASAETVAGLAGAEGEQVREERLKGIAVPVRIVSIGWR